MVITNGVTKGEITAELQGATSQVPPLMAKDKESMALAPAGHVAFEISAGRGPPCQPAPQAVKELTPPTVADTRAGGCSLSSWHIALGHRK